MGNILVTISILCVAWSILLLVLLFKSQLMDSKKGKNVILVLIIGALMLYGSAYLMNVGENLNEIIFERKSANYQLDEEDIKEYKINEGRYINNGLQTIAIIGLLFLSGMEIIWITKTEIEHMGLRNRSKWNLKEVASQINNRERAV